MKKTPLYDCHVKYGGKIVDFCGFSLPIQYKNGIISEHNAVRNAAGLFDVSHMGEVVISGYDALNNIQRLFTNDFYGMYDGQVRYTLMCNDSGGVVDDVLVYRVKENEYFIVLNAANIEKDIEWISKNITGNAMMKDLSGVTAQLALQGPKSLDILAELVDKDKLPVKYYTFCGDVELNGIRCMVSKTGYTGEAGFEIYCENKDAPTLWELLLRHGEKYGLIPCGLGARDTLRFEAGMPLYGHELGMDITPFEAGLGFFVKPDKPDFMGKAALAEKAGPARIRAGLKILGRGIARENCDVYSGEKTVGKTTSGNFCPTLGYPAAMALIDTGYSEIGTALSVDVRGKRLDATVIKLPFYKREKK